MADSGNSRASVFTTWLRHLEQDGLIRTGAVRPNAYNPYAHEIAQKPEKALPK